MGPITCIGDVTQCFAGVALLIATDFCGYFLSIGARVNLRYTARGKRGSSSLPLLHFRYAPYTNVSYIVTFYCIELLNFSHSFKDIFLFLDQLSSSHNPSLPPLICDHFLLAVHSQDATVVYYNIARGLVKPVN